MVSPSKVVWKKVVCQSSMGSSTIQGVQRALKAKGLYSGPIDGIYGSATKSAIRSYQKAKGLPVAGLSVATMESLGLY